ncbi:MAG: putative Small GTP-binding domain protein [Promethearchaeota archaeon]|nr:MAG: putative Small GTP-binding domain protein [Candidatus Lokiarchaeota archaeon]
MVDELNIKLSVLGDGGVGKTSIANGFTNNEFPERYMPTIGSSISKKNYKLEEDNYNIKVNIWDIGAQRSFNPLNPVFFNNIDVSFLVFDLSNAEETFKALKGVYLKNLKEHSEECLSFLVGNKLDLLSDKEELKKIIKDLNIEQLNLPLVAVSAKTGENLNKAFELMIFSYLKELKNKFPDKDIPDLSQKFLKHIDKTQTELKELFLNSESIESFKIKKEPEIDISKKILQEEKEESEDMFILQQRIEDLEIIKDQIINNFGKNMESLRELILNLKNVSIDSLIENINRTNQELQSFEKDFELKLDTLLNFENLRKEEKTKEPLEKEVLNRQNV